MANRPGNARTATIQARAKAPSAKTASSQAPTKLGAARPAAPSLAGMQAPAVDRQGDALLPSEVRARLWDLCSPLSLADFDAPWDGIARGLWEKLAEILKSKVVLDAATAASRLSFVACTKTLARSSPATYRILIDIRGLALAVAPALLDAEKDRAAIEPLPGSALIYESIEY